MEKRTNAIEALTDKKEEISSIKDANSFHRWKERTCITLSRIYGYDDNSIQIINSKRINKFNSLEQAKKDSDAFISSLITDLTRFDIPDFSKNIGEKSDINLNVNQTNTQSQSTNVSIDLNIVLDVLESGLRDYEFEELKDILDSKEEPKEKKKKFVDKIKSFGADVSSNILANLLTNPMVFEQLGKMF